MAFVRLAFAQRIGVRTTWVNLLQVSLPVPSSSTWALSWAAKNWKNWNQTGEMFLGCLSSCFFWDFALKFWSFFGSSWFVSWSFWWRLCLDVKQNDGLGVDVKQWTIILDEMDALLVISDWFHVHSLPHWGLVWSPAAPAREDNLKKRSLEGVGSGLYERNEEWPYGQWFVFTLRVNSRNEKWNFTHTPHARSRDWIVHGESPSRTCWQSWCWSWIRVSTPHKKARVAEALGPNREAKDNKSPQVVLLNIQDLHKTRKKSLQKS